VGFVAEFSDVNQPGFSFSFWEKEFLLGSPDAAVIGGGITGLTTAIFLKKKNPAADVAVFERAEWSAGASTRNAGFACFGSLSELLDDNRSMTESEVFRLVERRWLGLGMLRELLGDGAIEFSPCGGIELFADSDAELAKECLSFMPRVNEMLRDIVGQNVYDFQKDVGHFASFHASVFNRFEGKLNTGRMYRSLVEKARETGVRLFFGCEVNDVEESGSSVLLSTPGGTFKAGRAVVCTNGFARKLLPGLDVKPARNMVLVSQPVSLPFNEVYHYDKGYVYFREAECRLLLGGARNVDLEREMTDSFEPNERIFQRLDAFAREFILPGKPIEWAYKWTGIMGIGGKKSPLIGSIGKRIHYAVRLGGMGVALGTLIGMETANHIDQS
jgi:gamma-glutamylputrescine oxidase